METAIEAGIYILVIFFAVYFFILSILKIIQLLILKTKLEQVKKEIKDLERRYKNGKQALL